MPRRPASALSTDRLRELARVGAETVLKRLRAEIIAIERTFPELALPRRRQQLRNSVAQASAGTRRMSAAARKAVSNRMKRYWAERRKAQRDAPSSAEPAKSLRFNLLRIGKGARNANCTASSGPNRPTLTAARSVG
jgi:hypothetical protein